MPQKHSFSLWNSLFSLSKWSGHMFNVIQAFSLVSLLRCTVHCRSLLQDFSLSSLCKTFTPECWTKTRKKIVFDFTCSLVVHHLYESCFLRTSFVGGGKQWHRQMSSSQAKKCNGILLKKNFEKSFAKQALLSFLACNCHIYCLRTAQDNSSGMLKRQAKIHYKTKQGSGVIIPNFSGHATR